MKDHGIRYVMHVIRSLEIFLPDLPIGAREVLRVSRSRRVVEVELTVVGIKVLSLICALNTGSRVLGPQRPLHRTLEGGVVYRRLEIVSRMR